MGYFHHNFKFKKIQQEMIVMRIEIPADEFKERIKKVQKLMGEANLDTVLAFSTE